MLCKAQPTFERRVECTPSGGDADPAEVTRTLAQDERVPLVHGRIDVADAQLQNVALALGFAICPNQGTAQLHPPAPKRQPCFSVVRRGGLPGKGLGLQTVRTLADEPVAFHLPNVLVGQVDDRADLGEHVLERVLAVHAVCVRSRSRAREDRESTGVLSHRPSARC